MLNYFSFFFCIHIFLKIFCNVIILLKDRKTTILPVDHTLYPQSIENGIFCAMLAISMNEQILSYSIRLLSSRDYPEKILEEKIQKKFSSAEKEEIQKVINFLKEKKYIDDERTAENFVRYRREYFPRGRMMIEQEMWKKKFSAEVIAKAIQDHFTPEQEKKCCLDLLQKKLPSIQSKEENVAKQKEKLFRFLAGKGFNYAMIVEVWEEQLS